MVDNQKRHRQQRTMTVLIAIIVGAATASLGAQWFKHPSPRAPRTSNLPA
jgi:hypothetical protein